MKEFAKKTIAGAAATLPRGRAANRAIILCYHSIHPSKRFSSASPELFERHLAWLGEHADVVPLADVRSVLPNGRPRVAITFDDGYDDNYEHAFPILERHGMKATFFVTTGLLERDEAVVERFATTLRSCLRADVEPMSWGQARELRTAGHEIGAHTWSHPNLAELGDDELGSELTRSKAVLEERLGEPVTTIAYPFGKPRRHVSAATLEAARAAGYRRGVAVITRAVRDTDAELALPRLIVSADSLETLRQKVLGAWDFLGWWQERAPLWAVKGVRPGDAGL